MNIWLCTVRGDNNKKYSGRIWSIFENQAEVEAVCNYYWPEVVSVDGQFLGEYNVETEEPQASIMEKSKPTQRKHHGK